MTDVREQLRGARSFLFVPGDRPERFERALASGADWVVADLEDAVPAVHKALALTEVTDALRSGARLAVRINDPRTPRGEEDLLALASLPTPPPVMVPKAEDPETLLRVAGRLGPDAAVIPLVETALGILDVRRLAAPNHVVRLALGHLDLCAELGLDPDDRAVLAPARFALLAASSEALLAPPVDGVTTEVRDAAAILADARTSVAAGFSAKLLIHPAQVDPVHEALRPAPEQLVRARTIVEGGGPDDVRVVDGRLVDRPVYLRALSIIARAAPPPERPTP